MAPDPHGQENEAGAREAESIDGDEHVLDGSVHDVMEKYRRLAARYRALVHKYEDRAHSRIYVFHLAQWAMKTSASGLCAIRAEAIVLTNSIFDDLDGRGQSGRPLWQMGGKKKEAKCGLRDLVLARAQALSAEDPASRERYQQVGGDRWIEVSLELLDLMPSMVMGVVHDVTSEVRNERELVSARALAARREKLRALGEMAAGIAHDLNNTFNALMLRLEVLERRSRGDEQMAGHLDATRRIVADAAARIARLQDFAGRRTEHVDEDTDLAQVIRESIDMARPQVEHASGGAVRIATKIQDLPLVRGVGAELRHVFINLLLNARQAMPSGGRIEIAACVVKRSVVCTVADTGTGIPPRNLGRIFEPFFTTKGRKGTGLGLSVAANIMRSLGGKITVANQERGGAIFTLTFPVAAPRKKRAAESSPPVMTRPGRILVIDDEPDNLEVMRQLLEAEGHEVVLANSGEEGLACARDDGHFDLVLCDIGMPDKSGWQVSRAMRDLQPSAMIVLLTGWGEAERRARPGVAGVVHKPIALDTLRGLVARSMSTPATEK